MSNRHLVWVVFAVLVSLVATSAPASAQLARTWVSGVGDDANNCSRAAPCLSFAGAIAKTAAGGEITVLDPGGFGPVTINKSISIISALSEGGILTSSTGILINAGPNDVVHIRGLTIQGFTGGSGGIVVQQAGSVYISDTIIRGFRTGSGRGVSIGSTLNPTRVFLRNVEIVNNLVGVFMLSNGPSNSAFLQDCTLEANVNNSMSLSGASASATLYGSVLAPTPVVLSGGAQLGSTGNNRIAGTVGPTVTFPLK